MILDIQYLIYISVTQFSHISVILLSGPFCTHNIYCIYSSVAVAAVPEVSSIFPPS